MVSVAQPITGNTARRGIGAWALISLAMILFVLTLIFVGALAALLPWWLIVAVSAAPIFLVIAWRIPDLALVLLAAVSFGLIPDFILPSIPIAGGALRAEDLGLFSLFALLVVKNLQGSYKFAALVAKPIAVVAPLVLVSLISAMLAIIYAKSGIKDVFNEARNYAYWLYLPLIPLAVRREEEFHRFTKLLFALAMIIAVAMIFQSTTGVKITTRGQFSELWNVSDSVAGITRSTTPGMFLMAGSLLWLLVAYALGEIKFSILFAISVLILLGGIVVGFGRGLWVSLAIGFVLAGLVNLTPRYLKTLFVLGLLFSVLSAVSVIAKPELLEAVVKRATSFTEEFERGTSLERRKVENQFAINAFLGNPLEGVGLGGRYKPYGVDSAAWEAESRYIHNTYLHAAAKMGLPGLIALVFAILYLLHSGWMVFRRTKKFRALSFVSFWVLFSSGVVTAFTQPNWLTSTGVLSVCIALYFTEYIRRLERGVSPISPGKVVE
ncbi:O-antigen ligase family protein [Methyloversatilis discipulorum]|uniref:O-antigen ligase family protein n=1 Tax=Methyloversatilis discipulorum TaxID=1119528 RepID=UPI0012F99C57|nr:O-antigen ligase family protein [Methyloversatilis discipulorum]